jgi:Leucine-rich repeat (LRR) protein
MLAFAILGAGCVATNEISINTNQADDLGTTAITKLNLSNRGLTQISQDVFKQTNLTELDLSGNHLTGAIPAEIRSLTNLEVLDLSENDMTGLPAEVGQLTKLKILDLSNNQLTGLPLELGQLTNLEILDLRGNNYSKQDLQTISSQLIKTRIVTD